MSSYAGLDIFTPPPPDTQNPIDQAQAAAAVARAEAIRTFSTGRISMFEAIVRWLQIQSPGPGDQANYLNQLDTVRQAEADVQRDVANWEGAVKGWAAGIQVMRSIARRNPSDQSIQDRLVFPAMPPPLAIYAVSNNL